MQSLKACTAVCQEIEIRLSSSQYSQYNEDAQRHKKIKSATFRYWISFLDAGDTLLKLLRAYREADFEMHLTAVLEVIPYFFPVGGSNYARYTPVYVAEMRHLKISTHVSAHVGRWFRSDYYRYHYAYY